MTRPRLRRRLASAGCSPLRSRARACSRWVGRWTSHVASFARAVEAERSTPTAAAHHRAEARRSAGANPVAPPRRDPEIHAPKPRDAGAQRSSRARVRVSTSSSTSSVFVAFEGDLRRRPRRPAAFATGRLRRGCAPRVRRRREVRRCGSPRPRARDRARTISCGRRSRPRAEASAADETTRASGATPKTTGSTRRGASSRTSRTRSY